MASRAHQVLSAHLGDNLADATREMVSAGIAIGVTLALVGAYLGLSLSLRAEWLYVALGGLGVVLVARLSANPRLFSLWVLLLVSPLNLSLNYGFPNYAHGGGEYALRLEAADPFIAALAAYLAWDIISGYRRGFRLPKVTFLWFAIMVMGGCWVIVGPMRHDAALELVRMAKMTILFLVIVNEMERPRRFLHCAAALTLSVIIEAVVAVLEYYKRGPLGFGFLGEIDKRTFEITNKNSIYGQDVFRVSGLMLHPNLLGLFLAMVLPIAIGLLLLRVGKGYRLLFLCGIVLGTPALVLTLSRGAWMACGAGLALMATLMFFRQRLKRRLLLVGSAAFLLLIPTAAIFSGQIFSRIFESKPDATTGREFFKEDAKRLIAEKPILGWGMNAYSDVVTPFMKFSPQTFGGYPPPVHHIYYMWWAQTGIVGLALYLLVWGSIIWTGVRNLRVKNEVIFTINAACLGAMLGLILEEFISFSLEVNPIQRIFWVLAGMIVAARYWRLRESAADDGLEEAPRFEPGRATAPGVPLEAGSDA